MVVDGRSSRKSLTFGHFGDNQPLQSQEVGWSVDVDRRWREARDEEGNF